MLVNRFIAYGISAFKKRKKAVPISDPVWLETLKRSQRAFGLDNVHYEYWSYPSPDPVGTIWVRNSRSVLFFLSDGFLKIATESQAVAMIESLNAGNFQVTRRKNKQKAYSLLMKQLKGESRHYRYWILSFFLYPLERFLKIAKI